MALKPYFEKDGITLYHGDCLELLSELPPKSFDLAMTDTPSLVSLGRNSGNGRRPISEHADAAWVEPVFKDIWRLLVPDSFCLSFYGWPHAPFFFPAWKEIGFRPMSITVEVKRNWRYGPSSKSKQEMAYLLAKGMPKKPHAALSGFCGVQRLEFPSEVVEKPLGSITALMAAFTLKTSRILDPFAGNGTTLIAAKNLGIPAVGIEVYEHHCEAAARRLSENVFQSKPQSDQLRLF